VALLGYQPSALSHDVLSALSPPGNVRTWDWICENGRMPNGNPFDGDRVPWLEGVCDAYDDPETRTVSLMWGTRLGKTIGALQIMACMMATAPMPGLFTSSTQGLVKRTVRNKIYPILRAVSETASQLPCERLQSWERIALSKSTWSVAWSGSSTTLADVDAFYGHANEIDKFDFTEQMGGEVGEGDPLDQWDERFKEYPDSKQIYECSPTTKLRSRIYKKLQRSNNCRFWVPCPDCKNRQVLKLGSGDPKSGGLLFDKTTEGTLDLETARSTSRYVCEHCRREIYDEHRFAMMRAGKWAPEGCSVNRRGRLVGTPVRPSRHWGGKLSSLYSLQLRWGDIGAKFVEAQGNRRSLQMFINGWLADVWEPYRSKSEPEKVGERLVTDVEPGVIPEWATWVFNGVDVQEECLVYATIAVGPGERIAILEKGVLDSWEELKQEVIKRKFEHEDGGVPLSAALTLIDSAHRTKEVYDFCKSFRGSGHVVMPCKGANNDCNGEAYQKIIIGEGTKTGSKAMKRLALEARGLVRVRVNPFHYEPIIQRQIDQLCPEDDGSLSIPAGYDEDENFLYQLCNAAMSAEPSKAEPDKHLWVKRWENRENDIRDCLKYARCAADLKFRGDWNKANRRQGTVATVAPKAAKVSGSSAGAGDRKSRRTSLRKRMQRRRSARRS